MKRKGMKEERDKGRGGYFLAIRGASEAPSAYPHAKI